MDDRFRLVVFDSGSSMMKMFGDLENLLLHENSSFVNRFILHIIELKYT